MTNAAATTLPITKRWGELTDGDVVDVQFILGETTEPKTSERLDGLPT